MPRPYRFGHQREWVICHEGNPDSLVFQVWDGLASRIRELDGKYPHLWYYTERQVRKWAKPSQLLEQLRLAFWSHVYRSRRLAVPIQEVQITAGFIAQSTWQEIMAKDANLIFVLFPPPRIEALFESLMVRGLQKLIEFIDEPIDWAKITNRGAYLHNIFSCIRECERRLHRGVVTNNDAFRKRRALLEELGEEAKLLNISPPEAPSMDEPPEDEFDYADFDLAEEEDEHDKK